MPSHLPRLPPCAHTPFLHLCVPATTASLHFLPIGHYHIPPLPPLLVGTLTHAVLFPTIFPPFLPTFHGLGGTAAFTSLTEPSPPARPTFPTLNTVPHPWDIHTVCLPSPFTPTTRLLPLPAPSLDTCALAYPPHLTHPPLHTYNGWRGHAARGVGGGTAILLQTSICLYMAFLAW